jgi:hypothetical protein
MAFRRSNAHMQAIQTKGEKMKYIEKLDLLWLLEVAA